MSESNPAPQHQQPKASTGLPGWQTAVMVLAAFIVGLLPFVLNQSKYASKDEFNTHLHEFAILQQQVAANTAHLTAIDNSVLDLQVQVQTLNQQVNLLLGVYGPTLGSPGSARRRN